MSLEIRKFRKMNNLTQAELAKKIGASPSTIAMYERGDREPNIDMIIKISDVLKVDTNTLLGRPSGIFISYKDGDTGLRKELSDKIEAYKLKHPLEEISEGKNKLIDYVLNVPENKAEKVLKIIQAIVEDN